MEPSLPHPTQMLDPQGVELFPVHVVRQVPSGRLHYSLGGLACAERSDQLRQFGPVVDGFECHDLVWHPWLGVGLAVVQTHAIDASS